MAREAEPRFADDPKQGYCPVLNTRLGSMGVPVKIVLEGQPVLLCCKNCVKQARANLESSQANLDYTRITSPEDGVIIDRKIDPGQTVAAQKQVEQVTIMNNKNEAVTLYIDMMTHLPVKKSFSWRDPTDKERNVEEEIFDNYRPIQNIMTPFDTTRVFNSEMSAQTFLTNASYNQDLSDSLFDPQTANSSKRH